MLTGTNRTETREELKELEGCLINLNAIGRTIGFSSSRLVTQIRAGVAKYAGGYSSFAHSFMDK